MALYNFTLTLSGVTADTENLEDALFAGGCDDALLCFYGKSVYLEFDRKHRLWIVQSVRRWKTWNQPV